MLFADRVGPVAADNKVVEVADDQQRRIFESESILLKLPECGVQVLALPFIFPAEVAALPDVGPTLAATCLRGAALKAVEITRGLPATVRRAVGTDRENAPALPSAPSTQRRAIFE